MDRINALIDPRVVAGFKFDSGAWCTDKECDDKPHCGVCTFKQPGSCSKFRGIVFHYNVCGLFERAT